MTPIHTQTFKLYLHAFAGEGLGEPVWVLSTYRMSTNGFSCIREIDYECEVPSEVPPIAPIVASIDQTIRDKRAGCEKECGALEEWKQKLLSLQWSPARSFDTLPDDYEAPH